MRRDNTKKEQPKKDSNSKRVNFDNERESKYEKRMGAKKTCAANDVSWYAANPELLRAAASVPFSVTTGLPIKEFTSPFGVPGICSVYWTPAICNASVLNQAANQVYSDTVHANSRNYRYDAPDQMMMVLATGQAFGALAYGIRAFGVMNRFSQVNAYTPKYIIEAMGLDYEDLKRNLSNMWFDLNHYIVMLNQFWIPNIFPVFQRWFWLNSNLYYDADNVKSQFYMFVQDRFYKYNEVASDKGSSLEVITTWNPNATSKYTWKEYLTLLDTIIDPLINAQDRGMIMGDLLNAFGKEKMFTVSPITADYMIQPVYDREVLSQIENAVCVQAEFGGYQADVDTNSIQLIWNAIDSINASDKLNYASCVPNSQVLNFHTATIPTPEMVMVATRLKPVNASVDATTKVVTVTDAGTELVHTIGYLALRWSDGKATLKEYTSPQWLLTTAAPTAYDVYARWLKLWVSFDWAPWIYWTSTSTAPTTGSLQVTPQDAMGDWDNWTILGADEISKMHLTAVYSELGVRV